MDNFQSRWTFRIDSEYTKANIEINLHIFNFRLGCALLPYVTFLLTSLKILHQKHLLTAGILGQARLLQNTCQQELEQSLQIQTTFIFCSSLPARLIPQPFLVYCAPIQSLIQIAVHSSMAP